LGFCLSRLLLIFVEYGYHDRRRTSGILDLEERMWMIQFFFTVLAKVEVFQYTAFVTEADDRTDPTSIACDTNVYILGYRLLRLFLSDFFHSHSLFLHNLVKDDV